MVNLTHAWEAADAFGAGHACSELVDASEEDFPLRAARLCLTQALDSLTTPDSKRYPGIIDLIMRARAHYDTAGHQAEADAEILRLREVYRRRPALMLAMNRARCILHDRASLTEYLRMPTEHWARIRHSNFIERTFGETRRRVKVIGRLPGEHSCVSLVWAVLDRAAVGWRGLAVTPDGQRLLARLRVTLLTPPAQLPGAHRQPDAPPSQTNTVGAVA